MQSHRGTFYCVFVIFTAFCKLTTPFVFEGTHLKGVTASASSSHICFVHMYHLFPRYPFKMSAAPHQSQRFGVCMCIMQQGTQGSYIIGAGGLPVHQMMLSINLFYHPNRLPPPPQRQIFSSSLLGKNTHKRSGAMQIIKSQSNHATPSQSLTVILEHLNTHTHVQTHTLVHSLQLSVDLFLKPPSSTEKANLHVVI